MTPVIGKRRHPSPIETESDSPDTHFHKNKKIKLHGLFESLSLNDDKPAQSVSDPVILPDIGKTNKTPTFKQKKTSAGIEIKGKNINNLEVNPNINVGRYSVFKTSSSSSPSPNTVTNIDVYVSEKLMEHFQNVISSSNQVIKWYLQFFVLTYVFQKWTLRLFNRFLKKYNARLKQEEPNNPGYRPFKFFYKITNLISNPDTNFTFADLMSILIQESQLEVLRLRKRRQDKLKSDSDIELQLKDIKYNYWDRVPDLAKDLEMSEPDDRFTELGDVESTDMDYDMDQSTIHNLIESTYGLYYYDYRFQPKSFDDAMTDDI